jgi:hypothetical protein
MGLHGFFDIPIYNRIAWYGINNENCDMYYWLKLTMFFWTLYIELQNDIAIVYMGGTNDEPSKIGSLLLGLLHEGIIMIE